MCTDDDAAAFRKSIARIATDGPVLVRYTCVLMVEQTLGAERQALTALFRANSARINGLLIARCGDRNLAEELTAQTFEAAAVQFARRRGGDVTPAWLTTVALRRLVDHWRHHGRTTKVLERVARLVPSSDGGPEGVDDQVRRALDSLPFNQRAAVTLRYLDDWSVAEIAEGLDMTYRAAESLLARGRRSLRAALEAEGSGTVTDDQESNIQGSGDELWILDPSGEFSGIHEPRIHIVAPEFALLGGVTGPPRAGDAIETIDDALAEFDDEGFELTPRDDTISILGAPASSYDFVGPTVEPWLWLPSSNGVSDAFNFLSGDANREGVIHIAETTAGVIVITLEGDAGTDDAELLRGRFDLLLATLRPL